MSVFGRVDLPTYLRGVTVTTMAPALNPAEQLRRVRSRITSLNSSSSKSSPQTKKKFGKLVRQLTESNVAITSHLQNIQIPERTQ